MSALMARHVALHTCAVRHSKERVSHFTRARCDIPTSACRTSHVRGATFQRAHVALHTCAARHSKERMSHFTRARCDIPTSACRTSRVRAATFQRAHVALHACGTCQRE